MADRTASQDGNWDLTTSWGGAAVPTIAESVDLATFHITANVAASCASLIGGASSELILTKNDFTCDGTMTLDNIAVTAAADMDGVTVIASAIVIGAAGSLTLSDDLAITADLEFAGGILDMGNYDIELAGNLLDSNPGGGALSNAGWIIFVASGTIAIPSWGKLIGASIEVDDGVTLTFAANTMAKALVAADTATIVGGGFGLTIYNPVSDCLGLPVGRTSGFSAVILRPADISNHYVLDVGDAPCEIYAITGSIDRVFMQTENFYCGEVYVHGHTAPGKHTLALTTTDLIVTVIGDVILGSQDATDRNGGLLLSDSRHTIGGDIVAGNAANLRNSVDFHSADIVLGGTFDGASIGVTSAAARFECGTLTNVDVSGVNRVIAWGCQNGGGNGEGVEFAPRQLGTMPLAA